jgi:hypothetical protein
VLLGKPDAAVYLHDSTPLLNPAFGVLEAHDAVMARRWVRYADGDIQRRLCLVAMLRSSGVCLSMPRLPYPDSRPEAAHVRMTET